MNPSTEKDYLGKAVDVAIRLAVIRVLGGLFRAGVIRLFVGAVVLAIFYQLFGAWIREDTNGAQPKPDPDTEA